MADWPKRYHPAGYDETGSYVVDTLTVVEGYQVQPRTWRDCALWCHCEAVIDDAGIQAVAVGTELARLGDFVMLRDGVYTVEPADGYYQRWAPVEEGS